jgi:hypothetical protein
VLCDAEVVEAPDCESGFREFESLHTTHFLRGQMREHIRTIKHITQPRPDGSGSYGWYFYCGRGVGVKVVYSTRYEQDEGHRTIKELRGSPLWNAARREMRVLIKVEESGITPKPYCLKPVKRGYKWYPGIFMEHIEGVSLYSLYSSDKLELCKAQVVKVWHQVMGF